jgi:hypothetical protein
MSDVPVPIDDEGRPVIWMSFCPDLGIYHCHREEEGEEPSDTKLTREEVLDIVEGLMKVSQVSQAKQLAELCAWARLFAHNIVCFYGSGTFKIFKPVPPGSSEVEESEDMKKFFAEWNRAHPTKESVPVVVPFKQSSKT